MVDVGSLKMKEAPSRSEEGDKVGRHVKPAGCLGGHSREPAGSKTRTASLPIPLTTATTPTHILFHHGRPSLSRSPAAVCCEGRSVAPMCPGRRPGLCDNHLSPQGARRRRLRPAQPAPCPARRSRETARADCESGWYGDAAAVRGGNRWLTAGHTDKYEEKGQSLHQYGQYLLSCLPKYIQQCVARPLPPESLVAN